MGMGWDYFENLELDYTQEIPEEDSPETRKRLLYLVKLETNGTPVLLRHITTRPNETVAVSPEFTQMTGWTLEDMQNMDASDLFPPASLSVELVHADNNLAAPWNGQVYRKNGSLLAIRVQGLSFQVDGKLWRATTFEPYI